MASGTLSKGLKFDDVYLNSQSISSGVSAACNLPSTYDDKKVVAIIPISVGPTGWGTSLPGVFSGVDVNAKTATVRAYKTDTFTPRVYVVYY